MNPTTTYTQSLPAAGGVASGSWSAFAAAAAPAEYRLHADHSMPVTAAVKQNTGITRRPTEGSS